MTCIRVQLCRETAIVSSHQNREGTIQPENDGGPCHHTLPDILKGSEYLVERKLTFILVYLE